MDDDVNPAVKVALFVLAGILVIGGTLVALAMEFGFWHALFGP